MSSYAASAGSTRSARVVGARLRVGEERALEVEPERLRAVRGRAGIQLADPSAKPARSASGAVTPVGRNDVTPWRERVPRAIPSSARGRPSRRARRQPWTWTSTKPGVMNGALVGRLDAGVGLDGGDHAILDLDRARHHRIVEDEAADDRVIAPRPASRESDRPVPRRRTGRRARTDRLDTGTRSPRCGGRGRRR